jgi:hypothetical protein
MAAEGRKLGLRMNEKKIKYMKITYSSQKRSPEFDNMGF